MTRVDAAERDRADEGVVHDLEGEQREGLRVAGDARDLFLGVDVDALDGLAIDRRRQVVHHGVEQGLNALVLERRAAQDRVERDLPNRLADEPLQSRLVGLRPVEIGRHGVVVEFDGRLDHGEPVLQGAIHKVGRDLFVVVVGAERLVLPNDSLHANEVDDALEIGFGADRQLNADGTATDAGLDVVDAFVEVGADLIHLVDEDDAGHVVLVGLAPDRLGLRLDALVAVEHADGAVEHAERTLHLDGEIHVAGRVDDVQTLAVPRGRGGGRRDRDAPLLLLLHPVHGRGAVVDFADLMGLAGIVEDTLGRRRLPGIDVRHDAEIAIIFDRVTTGHRSILEVTRNRRLTSDSARRRGWLPPSGACLPAS